MITATIASPETFTTVLHISNILSTAKIKAMPAGLIPTDSKTMTNIKSGDTLKNIEESFVAKSNSSIDLELFVEGDVAWITLDFPTE